MHIDVARTSLWIKLNALVWVMMRWHGKLIGSSGRSRLGSTSDCTCSQVLPELSRFNLLTENPFAELHITPKESCISGEAYQGHEGLLIEWVSRNPVAYVESPKPVQKFFVAFCPWKNWTTIRESAPKLLFSQKQY